MQPWQQNLGLAHQGPTTYESPNLYNLYNILNLKFNIYYCYALVKPHQPSISIHFSSLWFFLAQLVHFSPIGHFQSNRSIYVYEVHFDSFGPFWSILVYFGLFILLQSISFTSVHLVHFTLFYIISWSTLFNSFHTVIYGHTWIYIYIYTYFR